MPAARKNAQSAGERVQAELDSLRANVAGITGSLVATSDGFLVAHDVRGLEPTQVAALVATMQSVASRAILATGQGDFREAITRGGNGYLAIYAAGNNTIVAITGTSSLNVAMLQYQARETVERIAGLSAGLSKWPAAPQAKGATGSRNSRQDNSRVLPVRRPPAR